MLLGTSVQTELRSLAFGTIAVGYMGLGLSTDHTGRILLLQNCTDVPLWVSFDGIHDHFVMPSGAQKILTLSENDTDECVFMFEKNSRIYVKQFGGPATKLGFYVTLFYSINS